MGTFQKFCLRWNNHTTNLLGTLGHILSSEQHTDVTLCCQGEVWRLHKLVLCASSSHFEKLLGALPPGQSPIVVLDGPHPQDVASLIQFIYHGEVNVDQENLASLLRTAESLKIKGLAEVSSVTSSSAEHKNQIDGESQRHASRSRSRPSSCQPTPIYTLGSEYPVGMYSLVSQAISPQTQIVPDHVERDPSPLNLSFSGTLKNIHDETPQERQERRNRLDNLLYAATERSKKEERREARREAREAALREAAAMREASVMVTQDTSVLPPVAKRPRVSEGSQNNTLPAHAAFHIPVMNLTLPSGAATSFVTSHSTTTTQTQPVVYETGPHAECHSVVSHEPMQEQQEIEVVSSKSPVKTERIEVLSDTSAIEEVAVHSDESDTQSAPETPSDLTTTNRARATTPVPTCTTTATQVSLSSSGAIDDVSSSSAYTTPASTATPTSATNTVSVSPQSESGEEKVPPYFHTILRQVAEGNGNGEAVSTNAQRVTINMRTFKEEWRRQLLVDYNTRTNMSICMLCFTTFKSYDGPRKNTYVKHAKRFHPSLEEYSEEERDLIISMYEKYHKYDVDMQKEVNKSYRAANAIVALGKKGAKHNEAAAEIPTTTGTNGVTTKQETGSNIVAAKPESVETEAHDDGESAAENINVKEEDVATSSAACKSLSHSSEIEVSSEGNDKGTETNEEPREKVNNNNVAVAPQMKRSQMSTRAKTATATTVSV